MGSGLSSCRQQPAVVPPESSSQNLSPAQPQLEASCQSSAPSASRPSLGTGALPSSNPSLHGVPQSLQKPVQAGTKMKQLSELLKSGVPLVARAVQALAPMLPFPGAQAAELVGSLLGMVERAIANHDNLRELRRRAVAYLDLLAAYHPTLVRVRVYKSVVEEYKEQLQGILSYSQVYVSRNCIVKLFTGTPDKEHYEALCSSLADLSQRSMMALEADTHERVQDMQGQLDQVLDCLKSAANYFDATTQIRKEVDAAGGVKKLIAQPNAIRRALCIGVEAPLSLDLVLPVLLAQVDPGPHRHIRQPDLRVFWQRSLAGETDVSWDTFFRKFPEQLYDSPAPTRAERLGAGCKAILNRLSRLLQSPSARRALVAAVDKDGDNKVSVYELRLAFDGETDLPEQVERLISLAAPQQLPVPNDKLRDELSISARTSSTIGRDHSAGSLGKAGEYGSRGSRTPPLQFQRPAPRAGARSTSSSSEGTESDDDSGDGFSSVEGPWQLPPLEPQMVGREEEADAVSASLLRPGNRHLVLRAAGGMGKSSLAAQVGWKLQGGGLFGGAIWVDLREAGSAAAVEGRFCAAMRLQREENAIARNVVRIASALARLLGRNMAPSVLVVVDNAETALHQAQAADTLKAVLKEATEVRGVHLLVTSRVPLDLDSDLFEEHEVGPISPQAAGRVIQATAQDLTSDEAEEVAGACGCVPLFLRLVAEALVAGRLTLQSVKEQVSQQLDPLRLILSSLKPSHRAAMTQLIVFPAVFHTEAAAAVLQTSLEQAQALLAVLYRSSLLLCGGRLGSGYVIHKAVLQAVLDAAGDEEKELIAAAEGRYGLHFLRLLGQWTGMYGGMEFSIALEMARDALADITRLGELMAGDASRGGGPQTLLKADQQEDEEDEDIVRALSYSVVQILEALGTVSAFEPGWEALRQAAEYVGDRVRQANYLNLQARVAIMKGRNSDAKQKAERGLRLLLEEAGGNKDVQLATQPVLTAAALNNLGAALKAQKNHALAEKVLRQALELRRRACGEAAFDTIGTMQNLASCLKAQGKLKGAMQLYEEVLGLCSWPHPALALIKNSMANCVMELGMDLDEAISLYESALMDQERFLGDEHPDTLTTKINLARCQLANDGVPYAWSLADSAVEALRKLYGPKHPETLAAITVMGMCKYATEDYAEAEELFRQVLKAVGPEQEEQASSLRLRLADCVERAGRAEEAEVLLRREVDVRTRRLGPEHEDTLESEFNLAKCLARQRQYDAAAEAFSRVAELRQRQLGGEHEATQEAVRGEALCWLGLGRYPEAEAALRQVMRAQIVQKGMSHEDTRAVMSDMAECLVLQDKFAEAAQLQTLVSQLEQGEERNERPWAHKKESPVPKRKQVSHARA